MKIHFRKSKHRQTQDTAVMLGCLQPEYLRNTNTIFNNYRMLWVLSEKHLKTHLKLHDNQRSNWRGCTVTELPLYFFLISTILLYWTRGDDGYIPPTQVINKIILNLLRFHKREKSLFLHCMYYPYQIYF